MRKSKVLPISLRAALLIPWLLLWSASAHAATLSNASLQGPYSFVLEKVDDTVAFGPTISTVQGVAVFDPAGKLSLQGSINRNGILQSFATSGSFTLTANGDLQISLTDLLFSVAGTVSFDLRAMVATNAASGSLLTHQVFLAVKQPVAPLPASLLNGRYFLAERTVTVSGSSFQLESSAGAVIFDGLGNFTAQVSVNGSATPVSLRGNYQVAADGAVLLNFVGRRSAVRFGFTSDAALGFGATVQDGPTHDLYALTRADNEGSGNATVNGSYHLLDASFSLPSARNTTPGFSVAANVAEYRGDGTVSYQPVQRNSAVVRGTVTVNQDAALSFSGSPGTTASFGGGVGSLGHSLVAAVLNDSTSFHFLVGIRTPSQAASAVNAASFSSTAAVSPGALISIFGRNLARRTAQASSLPLPASLGGTTVTIGGIDAPLLFVSPFQLNVQAPFEVQPSGAAITIVLDGFESGPLPVSIGAAGPGVFTLSSDGNGAGIFLHGDFSVVTRANPAKAGETVMIFATGLGAVLPAVASGAAAPGDPPASVAGSVSVQIGGIDAGTPAFAGLAPGFAGLYQVNVTVPSSLNTAADVPVVVTAAGAQSKPVTLPVGQ